MKINITVEIPKKSNIKYEINEKGQLCVDRILFSSYCYPQNYGFIPKTLDDDGDPLDVILIADHSFPSKTIVPSRIIGALEMIDDGEIDHKLIAVIDCDPRYKSINKLEDLDPWLLTEIKDFFSNYKKLENKITKIGDFLDIKKAIQIYNKCLKK
ncbi:inorganic diphosphatase [Mycoplasma sp. SG1]|uniref:inorganic diphosphatase n=1 Tax=Mycoplasma sp. SG1 TaxID=2810348 RepID=UPI002025017A|nr:inorganic diphosphatase [Mycoplasma sp. SG1]URM53170.1 inorganic diphosphatase [Mycoplasma sp. SG1]